jgi:hypothetical protein
LLAHARRAPLAFCGLAVVAVLLVAAADVSLNQAPIGVLAEFSLGGTIICWMAVNGAALTRARWREWAPRVSAGACLLVPPIVLMTAPSLGRSTLSLMLEGISVGVIAAWSACLASKWLHGLSGQRAVLLMLVALPPAIGIAVIVPLGMSIRWIVPGGYLGFVVFLLAYVSSWILLVLPTAIWLFLAPANHSIENDWRA